jgi:hypothetical protein
MAEKTTILKTLMILSSQFSQGRTHLAEEQLILERDLWLDEFKDVPDDAFLAAARQHIREGEWFPRISEIWKQIHKFEDVADGEDDWASAWGAIKGAVGRYGAWGTTEEVSAYFGDKLPAAMAEDTRAIVQRLGWRELCNMDVDQEGMWRAQFRDIYNRVRTSRVERRRRSPEVNRLIADLAQKFAADRARLSAPKEDDDGF